MDNRDLLKSMLNNFINDKDAEASLDFKAFATNKVKELAGLQTATASEQSEVDDSGFDDE